MILLNPIFPYISYVKQHCCPCHYSSQTLVSTFPSHLSPSPSVFKSLTIASRILLKMTSRGTPGWLSQLSIRLLILGHDLRVVRVRPTLGSTLGMDPAWDSLSPSLSCSPPLPPPKRKTSRGQTKKELVEINLHASGIGKKKKKTQLKLGYLRFLKKRSSKKPKGFLKEKALVQRKQYSAES